VFVCLIEVLRGRCWSLWLVLTVWHRPVYFISTRTSLDRTSSRTTSWSLNGAPGFSTTKAVVGICFCGIVVEVTVTVAEEDIVKKKNKL
jgi:hypothetical protein